MVGNDNLIDNTIDVFSAGFRAGIVASAAAISRLLPELGFSINFETCDNILKEMIANNETYYSGLRALRAYHIRQGLDELDPYRLSNRLLTFLINPSSFEDKNFKGFHRHGISPEHDHLPSGMNNVRVQHRRSDSGYPGDDDFTQHDLDNNDKQMNGLCEGGSKYFNPVDLFEPAPEETIQHIEPPVELLESIKRLCADAGVTHASWTLSTKSPYHIIVNGKGVTDELKPHLEEKIVKNYLDYKIDLVDTPLVSNNLSAIVLQRTYAKESPQWKNDSSATCELLLVGQQPHKYGREMLYAVTSAHLLLGELEMKALESATQQDRHQELMNIRRKELKQRIDKNVYLVQAKNEPQSYLSQHFHLCNPPLVSFRSYQYAADAMRYLFKNDIALLPFEVDNFQSIQAIREFVQGSDMESISEILELTPDAVKTLTNNPKRIYAKGRAGTTVRMRQPLSSDVAVGINIPFILDKGCEPFKEGDSGSLIYIKDQKSEDKLAIGILKGHRPAPETDVYEAIVLRAALDDIENDYKHLVKSLKLLPRNFSRLGSTPRCGPQPARANFAV